ncbi:MAG: VOC family protein [Anaerolineae bacterium]|nr:VOC family protein [Gemmatimonadaceae bacterium]
MTVDLDLLLDRYDDGTLTRRQLLGALATFVLPVASPPAAPSIALAKQLNHATLYVRDVAQSQEFYQRLFGMPVLTAQPPGVNLAVGTGFMGLYPADSGVEPRIDHVCLGVDRFDADVVKRKLGAAGVEATIRARADTKELYFTDPNGIRIQVQDIRYRGGVGPLGARNP